MIFITLAMLLIASISALVTERLSPQKSKILYFIFIVFLSVIAGFRNGEYMPDYDTYKGFYSAIISGTFSYFIEISFVYIAKLSNLISNDNSVGLFLIYAVVGVSLKLYAIKRLSNLVFYSVAIYISNYFILQEMIQIRAGIATGFILLSLLPLYERDIRRFLALILAATLFHYSSVVFVMLWFFKPDRYNRWFYICLILLGYLIHFSQVDVMQVVASFIPFSDIVIKLSTYTDKTRAESLALNVFGLFVFSKILIFFYFSFFAKKIEQHNQYIFLLLKCYAVGIFAYIALSAYPEIAVRICYTFLASEIIIIPTLVYTIKGHILPRLIVLQYGLMAFVTNVYFTTFFNWRP